MLESCVQSGADPPCSRLGREGTSNIRFGVTPDDPVTFGSAAALIAVVALVATLVPARRATRVDPMVSLRVE